MRLDSNQSVPGSTGSVWGTTSGPEGLTDAVVAYLGGGSELSYLPTGRDQADKPGIHWLLAKPGPGLGSKRFLCKPELLEGQRYRHPGRYQQWLLGRAAAKALLMKHAAELGYLVGSPKDLLIRRTPEGWPQALSPDGRALPVSLTISHTSDRVLCALCPEDTGNLGADIETVSQKPPSMLEDFFTYAERKKLAHCPELEQPRAATLIWCIKEAVLKARRTGLTENTKSVEVLTDDLLPDPSTAWKKAEVSLKQGPRPEVWWRAYENHTLLMTIARLPADPPR